VYAQTITLAVAEQNGEVHSLGATANRPDAVLKLLKTLGPQGSYECATKRDRPVTSHAPETHAQGSPIP
jgi:hypothetical protein